LVGCRCRRSGSSRPRRKSCPSPPENTPPSSGSFIVPSPGGLVRPPTPLLFVKGPLPLPPVTLNQTGSNRLLAPLECKRWTICLVFRRALGPIRSGPLAKSCLGSPCREVPAPRMSARPAHPPPCFSGLLYIFTVTVFDIASGFSKNEARPPARPARQSLTRFRHLERPSEGQRGGCASGPG
jgi:hypothetical protein